MIVGGDIEEIDNDKNGQLTDHKIIRIIVFGMLLPETFIILNKSTK